MEFDAAQQQPDDPVAVLIRYVDQRNKPIAREQREKYTPEELSYRALGFSTPLSFESWSSEG
jgi:hypothetical protein